MDELQKSENRRVDTIRAFHFGESRLVLSIPEKGSITIKPLQIWTPLHHTSLPAISLAEF